MKIAGLRGRIIFAAGLALPTALAGATVAWGQGPFHIEATWKIGGNGFWDYMSIDPVSKLLYVTRGDHVIAVNTKSGKEVAEISGLQGTHGVVFANNGIGFISDGAANQVAAFTRKTNQILQKIPAGMNPDGIAFEPVTHTVWAFNGRSNTATGIDAETRAVVATVSLPGRPEFPVADGKGSVFDNIEDKSEIVRINAKSHKLAATWSLAPCEGPSGLSMDRANRRLFAVCRNKMMAVVDADTGKVVATPPIGAGPDASRFSPQEKYVFSSNGGDGTLTVIHEDSPNQYTVVQNLKTQMGARTMALDPDGKRIYLVTADFGPRSAPTAANPRPRPTIVPGSFVVLVAAQ